MYHHSLLTILLKNNTNKIGLVASDHTKTLFKTIQAYVIEDIDISSSLFNCSKYSVYKTLSFGTDEMPYSTNTNNVLLNKIC